MSTLDFTTRDLKGIFSSEKKKKEQIGHIENSKMVGINQIISIIALTIKGLMFQLNNKHC